MRTTRLDVTANRLNAIINRVPGGPVFASFDYTYDVPTHRSVVPGEAKNQAKCLNARTDPAWGHIMLRSLLICGFFLVFACKQSSYHSQVLAERNHLSEIANKLEIGMTRSEVVHIAGDPVLAYEYASHSEVLRYYTDTTTSDRGGDVVTGFSVELEAGVVILIEEIIVRTR